MEDIVQLELIESSSMYSIYTKYIAVIALDDYTVAATARVLDISESSQLCPSEIKKNYK